MSRHGGLATAIVSALAFMALGGPAARADFGDFTYATQVTPGMALPSSSSLGAPGTTIDLEGVGNGIPARSPINNAGAPGGTEVGVASLALWSQGLFGDTDRFDTPVTIKLTLTDLASGLSGTLTFQGELTGSVSLSLDGGGTLVFNNPLFGPQSQALTFGNTIYTVTADPTIDFGLPGVPALNGPGAVGTVRFTVAATDPPGGGKAVPEPASLALLGLGALGAGLARRRFRRAA